MAWIGIGSLALLASACGSQDSASTSSAAGDSSSTAKVAFLMPDTGSTRYELHDRPGFEKRLKELCPGCQPLYNNADGSADKQQQQFNSALVQGAKVIVLDPVDSAAAASLVNAAHAKGVKVIAYDRPIPTSRSTSTSPSTMRPSVRPSAPPCWSRSRPTVHSPRAVACSS